MSRRISARVVLLDEYGAVLLLCGSDPALHPDVAPRWWFTVGGEVHPGETLAAAGAREVAEETGLLLTPDDLIGPVWRRQSIIPFNGTVLDSEEHYFLHRTRRFEPSATGRTRLESSYIHDHRWCDAAVIARLTADGQPVYPRQLGDLLTEAHRMVHESAVDIVTDIT